MCGLAGYVPAGDVARESVLTAMGVAMLSRGPDDEGMLVHGSMGLVHRRLSIIDVAGGRNPVFNEDESICALLNGEIYNFRELRNELLSVGHQFRTHSDTEVLVHLYEEFGDAMIGKLNGMFVFAIYNKNSGELLIARDRMGQKPLYYHYSETLFAFSSDLRSFACIPGLELTVDALAVSQFLTYQYVPAPLSIYTQIEKLEPASVLKFKDGVLNVSSYWDLSDALQSGGYLQSSRLEEEFDELLSDSVRCRLVADVPVGAFLSGGLDSSVISSLMCTHSSNPVKTFSIGFTSGSFDESDEASVVADQLGTQHRMALIDEINPDTIGSILDEFGEPFADQSALPTYYLCKLAAEDVKVALSGDGADELMGGYNRYRVGALHDSWQSLSRVSGLKNLAALTNWLPEKHGYYGNSINKKLKHTARLLETFSDWPEAASSRVFSRRELAVVFPAAEIYDDPVYERDSLDKALTWPERMLWADCRSYLPDDILVKVDRMSMAHSLEVRSPFLDYRLVEFLTRLPMSYKLQGRSSKSILRRYAASEFPEVARRPKHGFEAPVAKWLGGSLFDHLMTLLDQCSMTQLDAGHLKKLAIEHRQGKRDHSKRLWVVYVLLRWLDVNT